MLGLQAPFLADELNAPIDAHVDRTRTDSSKQWHHGRLPFATGFYADPMTTETLTVHQGKLI